MRGWLKCPEVGQHIPASFEVCVLYAGFRAIYFHRGHGHDFGEGGPHGAADRLLSAIAPCRNDSCLCYMNRSADCRRARPRRAAVRGISNLDIVAVCGHLNIHAVDKDVCVVLDLGRIVDICFACDVQHNNAVDRVRRDTGDADRQRVLLACNAKRGLPAVRQQIRGSGLIENAGDHELAVLRPIENVEVKPRSAVNGLGGATPPLQLLKRAGLRGVNCLPVDLHPIADFLEPVDALGRENSL